MISLVFVSHLIPTLRHGDGCPIARRSRNFFHKSVKIRNSSNRAHQLFHFEPFDSSIHGSTEVGGRGELTQYRNAYIYASPLRLLSRNGARSTLRHDLRAVRFSIPVSSPYLVFRKGACRREILGQLDLSISLGTLGTGEL